MSKKHPALIAYESVWQRIVDNSNDASLMPLGSGDIVGRARLESELKKRGIEYPNNIVEEFKWWDEIGGCALARRLTRKFKKLQQERAGRSPWL